MPGIPSFARMSALVVEDQQFIRSVVVRILKQLEFEDVHEAEDGGAGLDLALEKTPDVIICDIEMKPTDGLTFLDQLRRREPLGVRTPVVFLTNHASREVVLKARDLGVNAFIAKPVSLTGLRDKLAVLLPARR